ncbi:MAG: rRNA maturation RNase YbeY [Phycisphaerae bacterium]
MKSKKLEISVESSVASPRAELGLIRRVATKVAAAEGFRRGQLSVGIVGARRMATLHRQYSGVDGATDVLTFDLGTTNRLDEIDGTIIVCAAVAEREARKLGRAGELALYVTHGILHLAGYDDHDPPDFERMHAREDELLTELGLGALFAEKRPLPLRKQARRR